MSVGVTYSGVEVCVGASLNDRLYVWSFTAPTLTMETELVKTLVYNALQTLLIARRDFIAKSGVFWDVTPCGSCKNLRFGVT
jgi:hypothetical protein